MNLTDVTTAIHSALGDVTTVALAVFSVLAGIFGVRKIIKLLNRS
jgi:hypothetical protein